MGQAERRALCAVVADIFADVFAAHVAPHQVAIGVRCGAERLAYGVRTMRRLPLPVSASPLMARTYTIANTKAEVHLTP